MAKEITIKVTRAFLVNGKSQEVGSLLRLPKVQAMSFISANQAVIADEEAPEMEAPKSPEPEETEEEETEPKPAKRRGRPKKK